MRSSAPSATKPSAGSARRGIAFTATLACGHLLAIQDAYAQGPFITIPDPAFEAYLLATYDGDWDGSIDSTEAAGVTGPIDANYLGIADLTGIEAFTALTVLNCANNQLTSLDVSANTALTSLDCGFNALTSLDVSANVALVYLNCSSNTLTSLDVSSNTA